MRTKICCLLGISCLFILLISPSLVEAASGSPGSSRFGYGYHLDIQTPPEFAIQTAQDIQLDWIAVEFDWASQWPERNKSVNWEPLDRVFSLVSNQPISIMVSITQPPAWGLTPDGPDPDLTAALSQNLAQRYPDSELAIELFPGANTPQGWGASPNPDAYLSLFKTVQTRLSSSSPKTILVLGGLNPIHKHSDPGTMDDLTFLQALYNAGAAANLSVIGVRLPSIGTAPTASPQKTSEISLRHYEAVRNIMLENNHQNGMVWVTGFSWDSDIVVTPEAQAKWLKQAFLMMRRQLYIGAAFFNDINSSDSPENLLLGKASFHPGIDSLREIIAFESSQPTATFSMQLLKSSRNKLVKIP